jgi:hypothetical protein
LSPNALNIHHVSLHILKLMLIKEHA